MTVRFGSIGDRLADARGDENRRDCGSLWGRLSSLPPGFRPASRAGKKAGGSQEWLPHREPDALIPCVMFDGVVVRQARDPVRSEN
jgi:hypothetical protein